MESLTILLLAFFKFFLAFCSELPAVAASLLQLILLADHCTKEGLMMTLQLISCCFAFDTLSHDSPPPLDNSFVQG